jgi:hypothetical protein
MKEGSVHLLTDGNILLDVVECPTASKVSQGSEHQQIYRRCLFVVPFMTTPSVKQFVFGDRHYQLQEIGIWKTKPLTEFLCHGRFWFQHQKIADVSFVPSESSGKIISSRPSSVSFRARTRPLGVCFFFAVGGGEATIQSSR